MAYFAFPDFDSIPDIHHQYFIRAYFKPDSDDNASPSESSRLSVYSKGSKRNTPHTYPLYFAENTLYLAAPTVETYPELANLLKMFDRFDIDTTMNDWTKAVGDESRAKQIVNFLLENRALIPATGGKYQWYRAIHCGPKVIENVRVNDIPDYAS